MKKCLVLYFSGTGNTKFVATKFKENFEKKNIQVTISDINVYKKNNDIYDYLVIGAPIYSELFPDIFIKQLKQKTDFKKIPTILFSTLASNSMTPAFYDVMKNIPDEKINVLYADRFRMANNFYTFMFKKTEDDVKEKLKESVNNKVEKIVNDFLDDKIYIPEPNKLRYYMAKASYWALYKFYVPYLVKKITINKDLCTKCRICENNCPTKSVSIESQNCIASTCALCMKCMNNCPENAFLYKGKSIEQYKL